MECDGWLGKGWERRKGWEGKKGKAGKDMVCYRYMYIELGTMTRVRK